MLIKIFLNFVFKRENEKILTRFTVGTPIIVIDTIRNKGLKFSFISEAVHISIK